MVILIKNERLLTIQMKLPKRKTLLVNNDQIAKTFIEYLAETVEMLNTFEWPSNNRDLLNVQLTAIIIKFQKNPRANITFIKEFSFKRVPVKYTYTSTCRKYH